MNASEMIRRITFSKAYEFLDRDPEQNFSKLIDWLEKLDKKGYVARLLPMIRKYADDPNSNWYKLAHSVWEDVDGEVRKTLFTDFLINGNALENERLMENRKKYQCNIPWVIMMDPASTCSPGRGGDPAARQLNLSFDEMDSIVEQGKMLGTCFYVFSGGEPLERREELIALCNKNSDCVFMCLTGGTLIDEEFAGEMLRVRNLIPAIRIDGFREETDRRRGEGTYDKLCASMEILKRNRLLFGIIRSYAAENCETVGSETFFDAAIGWGAKFAWFTPYLPVGRTGEPARMASAAQREYLYRQIHAFRQTKPLLTLNVWNDGAFIGGCVAAGKGYCHVSAKGDIEPCASLHYSDSNIRDKSLLEAFQSPLFMAFYSNQPFQPNLLRPCPLLDEPERLTEIVGGARSTHLCEPENVESLAEKCVKQAEEWKPVADRLWQEAGHPL